MSNCKIVDTFDDFLAYWDRYQHLPQDECITAWKKHYMIDYPELLQAQLDCYAEDGEDWRAIAHEYVFPFLAERLPAMSTAHQNLSSLCELVWEQARAALGVEYPIAFVIYVGIGCGAGWATEYQGIPAVLLGLENIAEEGWQDRKTLFGLLAHEIGHLTHFHLRDASDLGRGSGPWWQLYTEGFAQVCEQLISGLDRWHLASRGQDWLTWCQENQAWLAGEYLRRVADGETLRPFFGSWHLLRGHKQTGYYLGYTLLSQIVLERGLGSAALIADVQAEMRTGLQRLASAR